MPRSSVTPDVEALRALAHPTRLRLLGQLRIDGPATATSLAELLGVNTGQTSYHLRQLAKHGLVEEDAERGDNRDRWWRAVHQQTSTSAASLNTPAEREAHDAFLQAAITAQAHYLQAALAERSELSQQWREAWATSDWILRLDPVRARSLIKRLHAVLEEVEEAGVDTADSAPYMLRIQGFPQPGALR